MKRKIGILTFHNADNLGAVLQAYALQTIMIEECGVEAQIIDYKCQEIEGSRYAKRYGGKGVLLKYLLLSIYYYIKRRGFDRFRMKYLKLSRKYIRTDICESSDVYDKFIAGSDQIWNLECSGNDYTYYLDFVHDTEKKFSYAASLGNYVYRDEERCNIEKLLNDFKQVSVREESAMNMLQHLNITNIRVDADPTLMLSNKQWQDITNKRICKKKYILVYLVQQDVNVMNAAKEYAKKHDLKLISNKKSIEFMLRNSPADFLSWIYNAEGVFTNSFHGTAFSLIFNKPLAADIEMVDGKINNRVKELLFSVNAEQCILKNSNAKVEKANAEQHLKQMRERSIAYLNRICNT